MKTIKTSIGLLKVTDEEVSYDDAERNIPKGFRMVDSVDVAKFFEKKEHVEFAFWFWLKSPEWNEEDWRPVARGYNDGLFYLLARHPRASRGVYVKKREGKE